MVVEVAEARRAAEASGVQLHRGAQPVEEPGAAVQAQQRIVGADLKRLGQGCASSARSAAASVRSGLERCLESTPRSNSSRLASASPSERLNSSPLDALAPAPRRAGAGIEQHARDHEVEADARDLVPVDVVEPAAAFPPPIALPDLEMPPAAVQGDVQVGVIGARRLDHGFGGVIEPARVDREVRGETGLGRREHDVRTLPHGLGRPEPAHRRERRVPLLDARAHRPS